LVGVSIPFSIEEAIQIRTFVLAGLEIDYPGFPISGAEYSINYVTSDPTTVPHAHPVLAARFRMRTNRPTPAIVGKCFFQGVETSFDCRPNFRRWNASTLELGLDDLLVQSNGL